MNFDPTMVCDQRWKYGNRLNVTPHLRSILDGLMLGDGYYGSDSRLSAHLQIGQSIDHVGWIDALERELSLSGMKLRRSVRTPSGQQFFRDKPITRQEFVSLTSIAYRDLKIERLRWYPAGKKIVPRDLDVSNPIVLANWHMGDGTVTIAKHARPRLNVVLCTNGFTVDDVLWLKEQFQAKLNIHSNVILQRGDQPVINIHHKSAAKFIEIVRPHLVECFGYKAPPDPWTPRTCETCGDVVPMNSRFCSIHLAGYMKEYYRDWAQNNRDGMRAASRRHYARHRDQILAKKREEDHAKRSFNPEPSRAKNRLTYKRRMERVASDPKLRESYREKINDYLAGYREKNRDKLRLVDQRAKAKKRQRMLLDPEFAASERAKKRAWSVMSRAKKLQNQADMATVGGT